jgi:hypothetical protein
MAEFTFPMEFKPCQSGWQLSKRTADLLLTISTSRSGALPAMSIPPATP